MKTKRSKSPTLSSFNRWADFVQAAPHETTTKDVLAVFKSDHQQFDGKMTPVVETLLGVKRICLEELILPSKRASALKTPAKARRRPANRIKNNGLSFGQFVALANDLPDPARSLRTEAHAQVLRIRVIMARRSVSQAQLAKKLHRTEATVSGMLSGRHQLRSTTLAAIARALHCDVAEFWDMNALLNRA